MLMDLSESAAFGVVLHESSDLVLNDRINLRLFHDFGSGKFVLARDLIRIDGVRFEQVIAVNDATALYDFATSDPYAVRLRDRYDSITRLVKTAAPSPVKILCDIAHKIEAIDRIAGCRSEGEVHGLVSSIVRSLGATQFIYQWLTLESVTSIYGDALESRYLIGCRPSWVQRYITKLWYMNDPLVAYARTNAVPALSSQITLHRDDHWLVTEACSEGFTSGLVAPAHLRGSDIFGLLYVSNDEVPATGDAKLWQNRTLFRALSVALLDWRVGHLRREAVVAFALEETEITALRVLHGGGGAIHVAESLGLSKNAVYKQIFRPITHKMEVARITEALEKARAVGLLD